MDSQMATQMDHASDSQMETGSARQWAQQTVTSMDSQMENPMAHS